MSALIWAVWEALRSGIIGRSITGIAAIAMVASWLLLGIDLWDVGTRAGRVSSPDNLLIFSARLPDLIFFALVTLWAGGARLVLRSWTRETEP